MCQQYWESFTPLTDFIFVVVYYHITHIRGLSTKRLSNMPKVTLLVRIGADIQIQKSWFQTLNLTVISVLSVVLLSIVLITGGQLWSGNIKGKFQV